MSMAWAERPHSNAETNSEELDEDFLEALGSFEAEEDEWYDIFWSTIEESCNEYNRSYAKEDMVQEYE